MDTLKQINKIISVYLESNGNIRPHFFLTGATGSGKTHSLTQIAEAHDIQVISVNTAQITNEGIAGNSLSKVLAPLEDFQNAPVIVFFDEFDKAIGKSAETTSGTVQQEILKILEDTTTEVFGMYGKYNRVNVSNVLFVFAGSFGGADIQNLSGLLEHNVKPELLGRVGLHFKVTRPPLSEMLELVKKSDLIKDYCKVITGIEYSTAVEDISLELEAQYSNNIIGVRIISSLAHQYFINGGFTQITKRTNKPLENRVERDLSFS